MVGKVTPVIGILLCCVTVLLPAAAVAKSADNEDRVWLGVLIDDESLDGGILLVAVIPGGPAASGGLQRGDVLLAADDRGLVRSADLETLLDLRGPGERVRLKLLRGGEMQERQVTLARRPSAARTWTYLPSDPGVDTTPMPALPAVPRPPSRSAAYGFAVADVTPDLRTYYGAPKEAGVLVTEVSPGRAADRAGLRVGDVLVKLGSVQVRQAVEVDALLPVGEAEQESVEAWVVRENHPTAARLTVPAIRTMSTTPVSRAASTEDFETLERMIRTEIDRLNRRLGELHDRLERLQESRETVQDR